MVFLQFLSVSVTALCLIQKLPQILRIYNTKQVAGVSVTSVLLEETAYTLVLTYNLWKKYPLSAFFEYIFLYTQDILLLWTLAKFAKGEKDKPADRSKPIFGILFFILYLILSLLDFIPDAWMNICLMCVIPIGVSSKIVQLRTILKNKSAGQVSPSVWAIASYCNFARIITNLVQTKDMNMVLDLSISLILNISIFIACKIYGNDPTPKPTDKKKEKTT